MSMDEAHEAHLARVKAEALAQIDRKYRDGQVRHGGRLWEKSGLLDEAIDEAVDQVVYLLTLKEQRDQRLMIGRVYCAACRIVRQVVFTADAEMTCARCDGPVEIASGDEV